MLKRTNNEKKRKRSFKNKKYYLFRGRVGKKRKRVQELLEIETSKTKRKKLVRQIKSLDEANSSEASLIEYYLEWRTFQASDHLPLWVEIKIDFSEQYLEHLKTLES